MVTPYESERARDLPPREEVRQAISHWAKEEVTSTSLLVSPFALCRRAIAARTRLDRGSKIVNLSAHRSGADSNCYVLLSCGRPFERVRREAPPTPEDSIHSFVSFSLTHLSAFHFPPLLFYGRPRLSKFASGVADRSLFITGINHRWYLFIIFLPTVCVGSLRLVYIVTANEWIARVQVKSWKNSAI